MPARITREPPSLPTPAAKILPSIFETCSEATRKAGLEIDSTHLEALVEEARASGHHATAQDFSLAFPLKWDSIGAEVNFLSLLCVLSRLSPYQSLLSQLNTTAASIPRHLLIGLYLSAPAENHSTSAGVPLSSSHLTSLGDGEIADLLQIKIHQEKRVDHIPVATLAERGGPGSEVVSNLRASLNRIGEAGVQSRYVDLGAFVMETLKQCKGIVDREAGDDVEAIGHFIARLNAFLPQDVSDSHFFQKDDTPLHICKTPVYLLLALHLRFSGDSSALPWVPSSSSSLLPLIADEVIPAVLVEEGVVIARGLDLSQPLTGEQVTSLRAAAVHVAHLVKDRIDPIDLDAHLRRKHRKQMREESESAKRTHLLTTRLEDNDDVGNW